MLATLCAVTCNGSVNLTHLSYVLNKAAWYVQAPECNYLTMINMAAHEPRSYRKTDEWRLVLGTCLDLQGSMWAETRPSRLYVPENASEELNIRIRRIGKSLSAPVFAMPA